MHVLTQEDIHSGQYGLRDVVLPTVGTKTLLPSNRVADKYVRSQQKSKCIT